MMRRILSPLLLLLCVSTSSLSAQVPRLARRAGADPVNVVFILVDDQRWDAMSRLGHPFLETPALDSLAEGGVLFRNAYVTTSLCSPSRASILTGLYAHTHGVVDNQTPVAEDLVFFSQYLQQAGYRTAFIGKWHMGRSSDEPRRGWDRWVSFKGQGSYFPEIRDGDGRVVGTAQINVDGERRPQRKYITDELTDYAVDWLRERDGDEPFFLYLSHKAVHHAFTPAPRHRGKYDSVAIPAFPTTQGGPLDALKPMWVRNQRNSWHGAEFPFFDSLGSAETVYRRYAEALLAVDESTGRIVDLLRERGLLDSTLVVYMGDNGHLWGEQGLIDKRVAYEASVRVPLVMHWPDGLEGGRSVDAIAANIDVAPTVLEAAGLEPPAYMHGASLLGPARGEETPWRRDLLYEYFWERWAPMTPTIHALISERYKFIRPYGLWDLEELYDLEADPDELHNLAEERPELAARLHQRLFELLRESGGDALPLVPTSVGEPRRIRNPGRSGQAEFPDVFFGSTPR